MGRPLQTAGALGSPKEGQNLMGRGAGILGDPHTGGVHSQLLVRTERGVCDLTTWDGELARGASGDYARGSAGSGDGASVCGNGGASADGGVCGSPEKKCHF